MSWLRKAANAVTTAQQPPQTTGQGSAIGEVLLWIALLIVLTVAGGVVLLVVRSRMFGSQAGGEHPDAPTMMAALTAMRERGEISEEEFEATRASLLSGDRPRPGTPPHAATPSTPSTEHPITQEQPDHQAPPATETGPDQWHASPGFDLAGDPLPPRAGPDESPPGNT